MISSPGKSSLIDGSIFLCISLVSIDVFYRLLYLYEKFINVTLSIHK